IANGSKRSAPTLPVAAAVVSLLMIEPRNVPCCHDSASLTSGTIVPRRPPNRIAEIGTPFGSSHAGEIDGHWRAGVVNRECGGAALRLLGGVHDRRSQSVGCAGGSLRSSHHTSPSSVSATFVKMEFLSAVWSAFGLLFRLVPGATPKNPASGLMAYSRPSAPNFIHAMSSPTVSTFQPPIVGIIIATF